MGLNEVRKKVIQCLKEGQIQHAVRGYIEEKNLLLTGEVSVEQVIRLINQAKGADYTCSAHHQIEGVLVHIFKPKVRSEKNQRWVTWYIKCFYIEPNIWFLSVHR